MAETPLPLRDRLYQDGQMSVGIVLPMRQHADETVDFRTQLAHAALADQLGFDAIWVRDVPLSGPWYPETIGHPDPFTMLGAMAATTERIAFGTAATVLPRASLPAFKTVTG
ncbi:LLM class flavin-dependent oxidoreductase [Paracoccaceae bacterium GXU_MW_L88]